MSKQRFIQRVVNFTCKELNDKTVAGLTNVNASIFTRWCRENSEVLDKAYLKWGKEYTNLRDIPIIQNVANNMIKPEEWVLEFPEETMTKCDESIVA